MKQFIVDRHTTPNTPTLEQVPTEKIPIYDTIADAESDLSNLEVGQILKTKDAGLVANLNPIDEVKQGVFLPPTSNAVAKSLSYSTTEQKTGGKIVVNGVEKDRYRRFFYTDTQVSTSVIANFASWNVDKFIKVDAIAVGSRYIQCAYFANASDVFRVLIDKQTQNITWECSSPCGYSIILEYTKNE